MNTKSILNTIYQAITDPKEREYFEIHEVRYQYILSKVQELGLPIGAKILDIGVYPPHLFTAFEQLGYKLSGISSQHEKVKLKNISILNIEKEKFPYKNNEFDLILMTEVIEHLTANPVVYLSEIKRVLKPNGYLLITTPNAVHLKNRMKVLFGKSASFPVEQLSETKSNDDSIYYRHNREFTLWELEKIVQMAGFKIQKSDYFSAYTPGRKRRKTSMVKHVGYALTQISSSLRDSLFVLASKS
jgi:2-polyprenyl-6-hydroxyphenyl methylase/3-demethylubiquinone-9 3-methyltransferase